MLDLNHRSLSSKVTLAYSTLATPQYCSNIVRLAGLWGLQKKIQGVFLQKTH